MNKNRPIWYLNTSKFIIFLSLLLLSNQVNAQDTTKILLKDSLVKVSEPHKVRTAIGISAGTNALAGIDISMHILPFLNIKAGYNYFSYNNSNVKLDFNSLGVEGLPEGKIGTSLSMNQNNFSVISELAVGKRKMIRFALGGVYSPSLKLSSRITYKEDVVIGDFVVTPEDIGYMQLNYTTKSKISPYMGLGFDRTVPRKRVGLSWDIGTYYRDSPVIAIDATGMLKDNKSNEEPLNRNFKAYKWYPVSNLRLAIRLN